MKPGTAGCTFPAQHNGDHFEEDGFLPTADMRAGKLEKAWRLISPPGVPSHADCAALSGVRRRSSYIPLADAANLVLVQEPERKTVAKHLLK